MLAYNMGALKIICGAPSSNMKKLHSPITVFSPVKADLVAVYSAFSRLVRGRSGRIGETVMIIYLYDTIVVMWLFVLVGLAYYYPISTYPMVS